MSISTTYSPKEVEDKWYSHWMAQDFFSARPNADKKPYCIVIPPPNVTGVLHMGHMLNNTIQDVLVRKARMEGKEACWVPGTDHASIATEARVVAMLREKGIDKKSLTREEFLKYAFEWKEKYGGIILEQLKKLGASCDWSRTKFTMDDEMTRSVVRVFVDLYEKGHIYRGVRMVNWDPVGLTAISDDEVIHREVNSKLYYVKYQVAPQEGDREEMWMTIATTRPETILGDTAVCVHPEDQRYAHLVGRQAIIPFVNRHVPIIADDYIDMEFGTGCLKVTPAHDINDYEIGLRHNLEVIDTIADNGTMSEAAEFYVGEDRFAVRKKIAKDLDEMGHLVKVEDIVNKNGYSERTDAVIEPKLSLQWFLKMKELSDPALQNVMNDAISLHPPKFKNMYRNWMENVRDWCISRQLWWGQQIPAYYLPDGQLVVADTVEEAVEKARELTQNTTLTAADLRQDEDVLDTWFSSWLWPISVFNGILEPDNEDIKYFYPTDDLVTAPEILFFWVARMVMAGYEYRDEKPFKNVYLTGIVRDTKGRKMSKSLGNSPDPLDLIEQYGADGVRVGMLFSSPAGNDLLFDEKLCEQGRNFSNKIWNAFRLVKGWEVDKSLNGQANEVAVNWINSRIDETLIQIGHHYKKYKISDALMAIYKLIWDDFCSWYLEMIKPEYQQPIDPRTLASTTAIFERLIKVLHPFMPFITEELWHNLQERTAKDCLMVAAYPTAGQPDHDLLGEAKNAFELITAIRNLRNAKQISPKEELELYIRTGNREDYWAFEKTIVKLAKLSVLDYVTQPVENAGTFVIGGDEFYVPLAEHLDEEQEKERLTKEIEYLKGFLKSVNGKLSNDRFVANAPEQVVQTEKNKRDDAEAKIKVLEDSLVSLG